MQVSYSYPLSSLVTFVFIHSVYMSSEGFNFLGFEEDTLQSLYSVLIYGMIYTVSHLFMKQGYKF